MTQSFLPGDETWYPSDSPTSRFSAIFEDDGDTGYFYAFERSPENDGGGKILDACHIYDVRDVVDREIPSEAQIIWTSDGLKAALLLNGHAHAVLDFVEQRGYCRANWPPPGGAWRAPVRAPWSDDLIDQFRGPGD
jgi:hypothetical protein